MFTPNRKQRSNGEVIVMNREDVLTMLGQFPTVSKQRYSRVLEERTAEWSRYKIWYETEPGEEVLAWLLVPSGRKNSGPAVVACHQHGDEYFVGKAEPIGLYAQAANTFALTLCRAGYVVLCPDMLGFEDRRPPELARKSVPGLADGQYERHLFMEYLLHGSTLQAKYIADLTRAVDVLAAQPETDPNRIGAVGHSLGGQEALWLFWYDLRVRALVTSCGFCNIKDLQQRGINHNYAMYLPGFLNKGDMQDIVTMLCPRPVCVCHGAQDPIYPVDSVQQVIDRAEQVYRDAGCTDHFQSAIFPNAGHVFEEEQQKYAIDFLNKWL